MKILLDACVPRGLRKYLTEHQVATAQEMGWARLKNGKLLREAQNNFDLFITTDKNLKHQQNFKEVTLGILVLPTNDWLTLLAHTKDISAAAATLQPCQFLELEWE